MRSMQEPLHPRLADLIQCASALSHRSRPGLAPFLLWTSREGYLRSRLAGRPGAAAFRVVEIVPASSTTRPRHSLLHECRCLLVSGRQTEFDWTSNRTRMNGLRVRLRGRLPWLLQACMRAEDCPPQRRLCPSEGLKPLRNTC